jgi:hypothetical protein
MDPKGVLNEYSSPASPTVEETAMLAHKPGGGSVSPPVREGKRLRPPSRQGRRKQSSFRTARRWTRWRTNSGMSPWVTRATTPTLTTLMASGAIRNVGVDKLDATQCGKV